MTRQSKPSADPEALRKALMNLLTHFTDELKKSDLREKVVALVPVFHTLRDLGSSLIAEVEDNSARGRILAYLRKYPFKVLDGDELMVVSGIGEWARRTRELRVQFGWWIYTGVTIKNMAEESDELNSWAEIGIDAKEVKPDQYILMREEQDREAAHRWNVINEIRKRKSAVKDKIIAYLRANVGAEISGEELQYLASGATEWARRVRELRTEEGWPIVTQNSGRKDLSIGVYVLEEDRQAPPHDRKIPDNLRVKVLERDGFQCVRCGWSRDKLTHDDPRKMLELHHKQHHKDRGENTVENLETLCNVCHDVEHRNHSFQVI